MHTDAFVVLFIRDASDADEIVAKRASCRV